MHDRSVCIGQHLQFDVARMVEIFLDIDRIVAERRACLGACDLECFFQRGGTLRHLHAAPSAAGSRLDQHRIANAVGDDAGFRDVRHHAFRSRHQWHAKPRHGGFGGNFVAHHANMCRRWSDEGQTVRLHHLGEPGILRQEAVAGMDRFRTGDGGGRQDRGNVEVTVLRRRRSDANAFIGQPHMHRLCVRGRMHRDGRDT